MDAKYTNLLRLLLEAYPETMSAQVLAAQLGVSSRSVKSYMKELNSFFPGVVTPAHTGYSVQRELALAALGKQQPIPQTQEQRVAYILKALLQRPQIDRFELCEEIFISISTLQKLFGHLKRVLVDFDLSLETGKGYLAIAGSEQNKRKLYSSVLYDECQSNFMSFAAVQKAFPEIDIAQVKLILGNTLEKYHLFANDYVMVDLALHVAIAVNRIRNGNANAAACKAPPSPERKKWEAAQSITQGLEKGLHIQYTEGEILELYLMLLYHVNFAGDTLNELPDMNAYISPDTRALVGDITRQIQEAYNIHLSDDYFTPRFALHINALLVRSRGRRYNINPLTDDIKRTSPLIYETAVYVSSIIQEHTGIKINDDEIAYIAMHLGNAVCTQHEYEAKIKTILYCPHYYDTNRLLAKTIQQQFAADILLENIYTDEEGLAGADPCDLVITTVPLEDAHLPACVQVNLFFQGDSAARLRQSIEYLRLEKKRKQFEHNLRHIIRPGLFERNSRLKEQGEVIRHMAGQMQKAGYGSGTLEEEVLEREKLSSTAFCGFAIPHSLKMNAHKTGMYVLINPDGIVWDTKRVKLVLMLCFKADERHIFHEIFEFLTQILTNAQSYQKIIQCKGYEEFIHQVVSMLE